jgi:AcrR family transcriptional regulator
VTSRAEAAVLRALDDKHREATEEVERILLAAVEVMARVAPEPPRVSDIVAEARSSNQAFYRYFASKDDLILAVLERGVARLVSYLEHQMAKETAPVEKIARWIEGALAQVADPHLISMSRAAVGQMSATVRDMTARADMLQPLRDLLIEPVSALGRPDPLSDADCVFLSTTAMMRRHLGSPDQPSRAEIEHLVTFCLVGIGARRLEGA